MQKPVWMNFFYSEFFSCDLCKIIDSNFSKINDDFVAEKIDSNFSKIIGVFWGKDIDNNFYKINGVFWVKW